MLRLLADDEESDLNLEGWGELVGGPGEEGGGGGAAGGTGRHRDSLSIGQSLQDKQLIQKKIYSYRIIFD